MGINEATAELFEKLAQSAKTDSQQAKDPGNIESAEYFRGVEAAFKCAAVLLED